MQIPRLKQAEMSFNKALDKLMNGRMVRRMEWEDPDIHLALINDVVMIYQTEDKKYYSLALSSGDILGNDWVLYEERGIIQ